MKCYQTRSAGIERKGVRLIVDCAVEPGRHVNSITDVEKLAGEFVSHFLQYPCERLSFDSNEAIGSTHMLYRLKCELGNNNYVGVRIVAKNSLAYRALLTLPDESLLQGSADLGVYEPDSSNGSPKTPVKAPPGQTYIPYPVIYNILGVPKTDLSEWSLTIGGEVENPLKLTLVDLYQRRLVKITVDFHCVTGWSVKNLSFTGVLLKELLAEAKPVLEKGWIYVESADGYSTIIPLEDALTDYSIIALEMNERPLDVLHGYPARLVLPHLYGWKSAKWVTKISVVNKYIDGYWEALGYHPRGNVALEERFKSG